MTLAKLQNSVKSSFDSINDSLKDTHSSLNKYSKALDKVFSYTHIPPPPKKKPQIQVTKKHIDQERLAYILIAL